ncbi:hypothetical protein [Salinibacter grassmerensis]|uniref:hypothetical protein n=1 Tax=Salinibacter grassmerensis TaxID=3040353 RepID=UPI0021E6E797|nr:hypothetical protein [Salinibacter grassmerensis]
MPQRLVLYVRRPGPHRRVLRWAGGVPLASILGDVVLAVPEDLGIGSIIVLVLPYSIALGMVSMIVFLV